MASQGIDVADAVVDGTATKQRGLTYCLLLAIAFCDGADAYLTPSSFRALEADLGFQPSVLGALSLAQALAMALMAPLWGSLCDSGAVQKKTILVSGVMSWGLCTIAISSVSSLFMMIFLRILVGASLACLLPVSQVIIAEMTLPRDRGIFFGGLSFAQVTGMALCGQFSTAVSNMTFANGSLSGWRLAYATVGATSVLFAFVLLVLLQVPPSARSAGLGHAPNTAMSLLAEMFERWCQYMGLRTFQLILLQGIFGSVPWAAMSFLTMFFQYVGFEDAQAASLVLIFNLSGGLGSLLGGYVGDTAAAWSTYHGRPVVGQLTVFAGIPLIAIVLFVVPPSTANYIWYGLLLSSVGLLSTWALTGVKRPILTEVVKPEDWASILALDCAIEGSSAAVFGAPLVGIVAEVLGYKSSQQQVRDMVPALRSANQSALSKALFATCVVPWVMCFVFMSLLHVSFQEDCCTKQEESAEEDVPLIEHTNLGQATSMD